MTLAHRMIVMNAGRAEQVGTPQEVYDDPATMFVANFIGSPPMNLIHGQVSVGDYFTLNTKVAFCCFRRLVVSLRVARWF